MARSVSGIGWRAARNEHVLYVLPITKAGADAYRGDDD
jgi:hypothetical protein